MTTEVLLVLTTLPDGDIATRVARALVEGRHAACVNIGQSVRSVYAWQGAVEEAMEVPLAIKTTRAAWPALEQVLRALHPYELPEIIALPVMHGLPAYLQWVADMTDPS